MAAITILQAGDPKTNPNAAPATKCAPRAAPARKSGGPKQSTRKA